MVKVIVGAQWGDEEKGKMIDYLAQKAYMVIRYQGGSNAGHTIVNEYGEFHLHLIPSGVFNPKTKCVIGKYITKIYGETPLEFETVWNKLQEYRERLTPFIRDAHLLILQAIRPTHQICIEAQSKKRTGVISPRFFLDYLKVISPVDVLTCSFGPPLPIFPVA